MNPQDRRPEPPVTIDAIAADETSRHPTCDTPPERDRQPPVERCRCVRCDQAQREVAANHFPAET